jgi:hypothetical protein
MVFQRVMERRSSSITCITRSLTDQAEELHANCMAALVELAKCRGVSLAELLDKLGIHTLLPD